MATKLNKAEERALWKVVEYLVNEEEPHFRDCVMSGDDKGHIFLSVAVLAHAIGYHNITPPKTIRAEEETAV